MHPIRFIHRKIDPEGLIPGKAWLAIIALGLQAGLLFAATLLLILLHWKEENPQNFLGRFLIALSVFTGLIFILMIYLLGRTVRRVMKDRRAYLKLSNEQKKAEAFTQNLINILPIGYHSIDKDGLVIEMNKTELEWLGYEKEEVIGKKHVYDLYQQASPDELGTIFENFSKDGYMKNTELNMSKKDGSLIPALLTSKAMYDEAGNFTHSITTVYNFTDRKKLENELIAARQEAENARHLKQLFMANMSHEIRTPLNGIIGFANLLARVKLPANVTEYVQSIQISGANLLSIVNDILDFEKIRSGMLRIEHIEFDLHSLLHSVITMVRPSAEDKNLVLNLHVEADLPGLLIGDPMRLTQILINLLGNAIKFTKNGTVSLRVYSIKTVQPPHTILLRYEVEDTGIGIPETQHERIFERFIQASNDMSRKYGGTGLGLALVKMLVDLQNGQIRLLSEPGQGSVFTVEIPYQVVLQQETRPAAPAPIESDDHPDLNGFHVLVVEDNVMNRRIAELNLLEFGLQVTQAEDGYAAVELLRNQPDQFHLVLMDIQMPGMDGYDTTRIVRSELGLLELPIVAMTAHVLAGEREKVRSSGMNDFLTKPVSHTELTHILLHYLPGFWDLNALNQFTFGSRETFREICDLFIRQFPQDLNALQELFRDLNFPAMGKLLHNMRSTTSYAGFQASIGERLLRMEQEVRKEQPDEAAFSADIAKLMQEGKLAVALVQREIGKDS